MAEAVKWEKSGKEEVLIQQQERERGCWKSDMKVREEQRPCHVAVD